MLHAIPTILSIGATARRRCGRSQSKWLALKPILINDLAADYEKLAERAEIKANGKKPRSNGKAR